MLNLFRRQRLVAVQFEVIDRSGADLRPVFVTGNHPNLGDWDPAGVPMNAAESGRWHATVLLPSGRTVDVKFTRGDWESEAVDSTGRPLDNTSVAVRANRVVRLDVPGWRDLARPDANPGEDPVDVPVPMPGELRFHRGLAAPGLRARDVVVWLPPGYDLDGAVRYPVLYMQDGQNLFDPATAYTGVDWRVHETIVNLIDAGRMRPVIVVGICNTPERLHEYSDSPTGRRYLAFLTATLKPLIDRTYRTLPGREHTAVAGSSMGGLISFLAGWYHPEVFSMAACLSPSFIFERSRAVKALRRSATPSAPVRFYIDCGGVGGERRLLRGCNQVLRLLRRRGWREPEAVRFVHDPDGQHREQDWGERFWRPLTWFFVPVVQKRGATPGAAPRELP